MSIVIFILILVALILVHEFGHFVVAKLSGMRVDEFGIGYPPRAFTFARHKDTAYTLNWLPFGGFVRIYGEDETAEGGDDARAFFRRPRILQAATLVAGIVMNVLFAWILLSVLFGLHAPRALTVREAAQASDATLMVANVLPGSPAASAGLMSGDSIELVSAPNGTFSGYDPEAFLTFVEQDTTGAPLTFSIRRGTSAMSIVASPKTGIIAADPTRAALGVAVAPVGTLALPWWKTPIAGAELTWNLTKATAAGLWHLLAGLVTFSADLSQVAGPVGIAGAVGTAAHDGLAPLLYLTALISINLALVNVLPIPALDGGRLLFVAIEAIIRRPIKPGVAQAVNTVGFGLLILLMVVITAHDIFKIVG